MSIRYDALIGFITEVSGVSNRQEKTMKTLLLLALVWLAIGFMVPTFAQEQNTVFPQVRQQIEALFMQFQEAYNKRDAAAIGAQWTQDAIEIRSWAAADRGGLASGRQAIEKRFEADFATNPGKMVNKLVQLYPIGNAICEIADTDVGEWKGQTVKIYVRVGDTWKIRMTYVDDYTTPLRPLE